MADESPATMWCGMCSRRLPLSAFYRSKTSSNGALPRCKECRTSSKKIWNRDNAGRICELDRKRARDPHDMRQAQKRWRDKHKAVQIERAKVCRHANPGHYAAVRKRWKAANAEKVHAYGHTRRALKVGANGPGWTASDVAEIKSLQRGLCAICRDRLQPRFHRDHILPLKLGGAHARRNLQLLCEPCNLSKGARHPIDHSRSLGLLL